jgi:hypothetical protein
MREMIEVRILVVMVKSCVDVEMRVPVGGVRCCRWQRLNKCLENRGQVREGGVNKEESECDQEKAIANSARVTTTNSSSDVTGEVTIHECKRKEQASLTQRQDRQECRTEGWERWKQMLNCRWDARGICTQTAGGYSPIYLHTQPQRTARLAPCSTPAPPSFAHRANSHT